MIKGQFSLVLRCTGIWLILGSPALASDVWHVEGDPGVIAQDIQFTNGDVHLAGTVYFPKAGGDHLPAVVALHGASDSTRTAALYRHLREGLPAMGIACSSMTVEEAGIRPAPSKALIMRRSLMMQSRERTH